MTIVGVASVRIKPDLSEFRRDLEAGLKKMNPEVSVKVHADTRPAFQELLKFEKFAERFHSVDLPVKADTGVLGKSRSEVNDFGRDLLRMGASATQSFAAVTAGLASLNSAIGILSAVGSFAVAASGSLLLIPGALFVVAGAFAAIKLGADGAKAAFEGLTPTVDRLQAQVSKAFERSLVPAVNNLKTVLPQLSKSLQGVAKSAGDSATEFTKMLKAPDNLKTLNSILGSTQKVLGNVGKAASPVGRALLDIGDVGGKIFVDLSQGIEGAANKFADFIRKAKESGQLDKIMRGGLEVLGQLLDTLGDIGSIVADVFGALKEGGAGISGVFGPAIQTIKEFVASAEGQEVFRNLGAALKEIGTAVSNILGPALKAIGPLITPIAELIGSLATQVASYLAPAFEQIGKIAEPLVRALSPFVEQIVRALLPIIPVVVGQLGMFASVVVLLTPVLMGLTIPIQLAIAGFVALTQVMRGDVVGASETMKQGFANASATMRSITETDWASMAGTIAEATSNIDLGVGESADSIERKWGDSMLGIRTNTGENIRGLVGDLKGTIPAVPQIAGAAGQQTEDVWGRSMLGMENSTSDSILGVADVFGGAGNLIIGALGDITGLLFSAGRSIGESFVRGIRSMIGSASSAAQALMAAANANFPHSPAKEGPFSGRGWVLYSGRAIGEDFAKGIAQRTQIAVDATEQMMREVAGVSTPDLSSGFSGLSAGFAAGDTQAAINAEITGRPVNVVVSGDRDGLREFVNVEIEEDNRNTRRRVLSGIGG